MLQPVRKATCTTWPSPGLDGHAARWRHGRCFARRGAVLGAADYHRDDHDFGDSLVGGDGTAAYAQYEDWNERNNSRVHEVELILELTARYEGMANSCEAGNDEDSCNDIPEGCYRSATGECHDWRIGHGLTDLDAAVALARTLQLMRRPRRRRSGRPPRVRVWGRVRDLREHDDNHHHSRQHGPCPPRMEGRLEPLQQRTNGRRLLHRGFPLRVDSQRHRDSRPRSRRWRRV